MNSGLISACILRSSAMVLHCSFFWDTMVNLNHLWYLSRASTLVVTWVSGGSIRVKVGYLHTTHYVNICSAGEGTATAVWIRSSSCKIYTFAITFNCISR